MKKTSLLSLILSSVAGVFCLSMHLQAAESATPAAPENGTPSIQFETNFFDFGRVLIPGRVAGSFKFKNTGTATLKVDPPAPSCGCTDAKANPDKLAPGETGEISYTVNLDHPMRGVQKHIKVHSNDPKNPDVQLTMALDYSPLYELTPGGLRITLGPEKRETRGSFTITRTDGKPLDITGMTISQKTMSLEFDPSYNPQSSVAQVNITVHRPPNPPPPILIGNVQLWNTNMADRPVQTLLVTSDVQGELSAVPSKIYWVIPDFGDSMTNYPAAALTRTVELKSLTGKPVEIKNAATSVKGMSIQIVPKEPGKVFDLVLKFDELPHAFTNGTVSVETSLAALPRVEVPVTIGVANAR